MSLGIIVDNTVHLLTKYQRGRNENGLSVPDAIRYSYRTVGMAVAVNALVLAFGFAVLVLEWDIGFSYFYGTSREARLEPSDDLTRFEPRYDQIHQLGLDLQYTKDAWLWKFEGIIREGQGTFGALVGGFEYTFYQVEETDTDLGVLAEYLHDGRNNDKAPPTAFDNDLFLGARLTLNDIDDSAALVGAVVDLDDQTTSLRLEAERRFGDSRKIELESQWFANVDDDNPLAAVEDDSYVLLRFTQFF